MSEFFEGGTSWSGCILVLPVALVTSINGVEHRLQFEQDPNKNIYYHLNGMASFHPINKKYFAMAINFAMKHFFLKTSSSPLNGHSKVFFVCGVVTNLL